VNIIHKKDKTILEGKIEILNEIPMSSNKHTVKMDAFLVTGKHQILRTPKNSQINFFPADYSK